jgi:hypothetical protein
VKQLLLAAQAAEPALAAVVLQAVLCFSAGPDWRWRHAQPQWHGHLRRCSAVNACSLTTVGRRVLAVNSPPGRLLCVPARLKVYTTRRLLLCWSWHASPLPYLPTPAATPLASCVCLIELKHIR